MLNKKQEEILVAVWRAGEVKNYAIGDIKKRCVVDFTDADIEELEKKGFIVSNNNNILFSRNGKELAERIIRRHRLAEVLMSSILNLRHDEIEKVACHMEHSLAPEVEESICTLLGHPGICPDGKPIPKGKCCRKKLRTVSNTVVGLDELKSGEKGKIKYILPDNHSNLHRLMSFGLRPGVTVSVHRTTPAFCIKFENTELAIDKEIASNIFVWKIED